MRYAPELHDLLMNDIFRCRILKIVHSLKIDDCWIGAGFVRNAVWNTIHDMPSVHDGDIDVIWFDREATKSKDIAIEKRLSELDPTVKWSVKNQARMHVRNRDKEYTSAIDATKYWPETATAVAVRWLDQSRCEIAAPYGLDDLYHLKIRPTPAFRGRKRHIFDKRVEEKGWLSIWPQLEIIE